MILRRSRWLSAGEGRSFAAVSFETATSERGSACAVGVVSFDDGVPVDEFEALIRPPGNRYDSPSTAIHGIGPSDTSDCGGFADVWHEASAMINGRLVIVHNAAFAVSVLRRSSAVCDHEPEPFWFACTYRVARSALPDAKLWSLDAMAGEFGVEHSASGPLGCARATALLWIALGERSGVTHAALLYRHGFKLGYCHPRSCEPFANTGRSSSQRRQRGFKATDFTARRAPDPGGPLFAKRVAFTGPMGCMSRREAFQAAVDAGAEPSQSVSGRTDYLVVGVTERDTVGESGTTIKHRQALALTARGNSIEIIDEDRFMRLLDTTTQTIDSPPRT